MNVLSFLPEAIDSLPDEIRQRIELTKDIPIEMLQKLREEVESAKGTSYDEQVIEEDPGMCAATIYEAYPQVHYEAEKMIEEAGVVTETSVGDISPRDVSYTINKHVIIHTTDDRRIKVGSWGENLVLSTLRSSYLEDGYEVEDTPSGFITHKNDDVIELKNKNAENNIQHGYDFELVKNGQIVEYIEVKSKVSEDEEMFSVSGTQWEKAKMLYNNGQGDVYVIYVVSSAGKSNARITKYKNPFKLWKEGRLYADPVNIKL
jgi:hypothetical protein